MTYFYIDLNFKDIIMFQKYERKRWYVSPSEIAEQRRLLEAHSRRDSTSAISINSHKSNQSAPANLQPEKKNDFDILGGDLMFPVKEEPATTTAQSAFSSSFQSTVPTPLFQSTAPPPLFPPPNSFSSNDPLSSHSSTPQPLQFDFFGAPSAKVSSPPAKQLPHQNTFDFFGPPSDGKIYYF